MTKFRQIRPRYGFFGSRRRGQGRRRIGLRKSKSGRRIPKGKGIIHIQAGFNNTIITATDALGRVVYWSSAGTCRFKGPRKGTPFAAQNAAGDVIRTVVGRGMKRAKVMLKGAGRGRDAALRAIRNSRIRVRSIRDVTPIPHNGCRPPKRRRV